MQGGFERNVATEMPRSGKGEQPKAPWDVDAPTSPSGNRRGGFGSVGRYPSLERGKSDVLDKIRDLKTELEGSFNAREELQRTVEETSREVRSLKEESTGLQEKLAESQRETTFQREEKEAALRKVVEMEEMVGQERTAKEEIQAELSEARLALDEIHSALK